MKNKFLAILTFALAFCFASCTKTQVNVFIPAASDCAYAAYLIKENDGQVVQFKTQKEIIVALEQVEKELSARRENLMADKMHTIGYKCKEVFVTEDGLVGWNESDNSKLVYEPFNPKAEPDGDFKGYVKYPGTESNVVQRQYDDTFYIYCLLVLALERFDLR